MKKYTIDQYGACVSLGGVSPRFMPLTSLLETTRAIPHGTVVHNCGPQASGSMSLPSHRWNMSLHDTLMVVAAAAMAVAAVVTVRDRMSEGLQGILRILPRVIRRHCSSLRIRVLLSSSTHTNHCLDLPK